MQTCLLLWLYKGELVMIDELKRIEDQIFNRYNNKITKLTKDLECDEYLGYNFQIQELVIKFRKAKITPKKVGQFVTLWKRNSKKETRPFHVNDTFDFYIIAAEQNKRFGFFLFPKQILSEKQILTNDRKEGKRGFRVYPSWTETTNKQAEKTKGWQTQYFIELTNPNEVEYEKYNTIINR